MSDRNPALIYRWENGVMRPLGTLARQLFVEGECYQLQAGEERSGKQAAFFFASVNEVWKTLPDDLARRFPSPKHLRKWALVHTGYANQHHVALASEDQAIKVAATARALDGFAVITIKDCVVHIYTAMSQQAVHMDNETFKRSVDDVLAFLAEKIGVSKSDIPRRESA